MDVVSGMDASGALGAQERERSAALVAGVRRLSALADSASDPAEIVRALAAELMRSPGGEEVHIHYLDQAGEEADELVVVHLFGGDGRLSYRVPRAERPPGVNWVATTGASFLAANSEELSTSVPRLTQTGPVRSALLLALADRGEVQAVVMLVRRSSDAIGPGDVEHATALVEQAGIAMALVRARAEAGTDAVTGSMNHRAMRRRLGEEIDRASRGVGPLSCLLIDLDDFKAVNDLYGHPAGDALLRSVVDALVGEFRQFDRVARYGGDEFVVILPNAGVGAAAAAGTRALSLLRAIRGEDGMAHGVSASIGVAAWRAPMGVDELLAAADAALLRSKRQGKGRVTQAPDPVV
jgi:diguanylate cyclase (GGDEF)-like protein